MRKKSKAILAVVAGGLIVGGCSAAVSSGSAHTAATQPVVTHSAVPKASASFAVSAAAPADPTGPSMTSSQQQAVDAGQSYLSIGTGFSEKGLLKQLTSKYGNGFSQADASFAVKYLSPDWNAQAVLAAKSYLNLHTGFSKSSLQQQLTSPYGNQFTQAQASYAVNKVMG